MPSLRSAIALLLLASILTLTAASPVIDSPPFLVKRAPIPDLSPAISPLAVTSNYATLTKFKCLNNDTTSSRSAARYVPGYGKAGLRDLFVEEEWALRVDFGGEEVLLILDTGSSDTWVAQKNFQCVTNKGKPRPEAACAFGPLYNGTFPAGPIKNQNFHIMYADLEFLSGKMGFQTITVGGITVPKQEVAIVDNAYWHGDGFTSGLMGFAYSALTMAYAGTNVSLDRWNMTGTNAPGSEMPYSPIITTMIKDNLLGSPIFSLALMRSAVEKPNAQGGYVAFGGLPPVSFDPVFASTPLLIYEFYRYPELQKTVRGFYTIGPDAYVYENKAGKVTSHTTRANAIIDSGTTLLYVPDAVAAGYAASFDPAPVPRFGYSFVPCTTKAPFFGITIGGTTFNISSADIVIPNSGYKNKTSGELYCLLGVIPGGSGVETFPIFGDVFLKNVVAVFDQGANMMRFAQHNY